MTDKKALRKAASAARAEAHRSVDVAPAHAALRARLDQTSGPVSFFWPIRTEIDPRPVMEALASHRPVCLPVTNGYAALRFRSWTPGAEMEVDGFGVAVPAGNTSIVPQVLVVPLLAFDRHGHRLGYGAGHYDRTLEELGAQGPVTAIGFAYAAQEIARVPTVPTDQPLDAIVTENGIIEIDARR